MVTLDGIDTVYYLYIVPARSGGGGTAETVQVGEFLLALDAGWGLSASGAGPAGTVPDADIVFIGFSTGWVDTGPLSADGVLMDTEGYLHIAAEVAKTRLDDRVFHLGAVGLRNDGVMVASCNGNPLEPEPKHHAEYRVSRKLGQRAHVYVARVLANGLWAMARPCPRCLCRLKNVKVLRVYYTIGTGEYGVIRLND